MRQGDYCFRSILCLRLVSNVVQLPCRTQLIELNSTLARQYVDLVSNVALLSRRTQFINYKYIRIHLTVC